DDETKLGLARPHPCDAGEPENLAAQVERSDGLDLAIVESEQPAERVAVAERHRPAEAEPDVFWMQQASELYAARQIRHVQPANAHGAEAPECTAPHVGIGDCVQITAIEPDVLQGTGIERV